MMSFFALIIAFFQKYDKKASIGTIISTMLPYTFVFLYAVDISTHHLGLFWMAFRTGSTNVLSGRTAELKTNIYSGVPWSEEIH